MIRRITTCLLLVTLAGIYAAPLAAAFAPADMDCCAAGMCPRPGHSNSQHRSHQKMMDCGMGSATGSMRMCEMGACDTQHENVIRVALFALSAPTLIIQSPVEAPVTASAFEPEHPVSQVPETPPPRISLS